jgi:hypothetical protein
MLGRIIFLDFGHLLTFSKTTSFWKQDLLPCSGKIMVACTLLGPLERASLNHWTTSVQRGKTFKQLGSGICQQEITGNCTIKINKMYIKNEDRGEMKINTLNKTQNTHPRTPV